MTDGPRVTPQAPDIAPGAPDTDGSFPAGVDSIGDGFDGSTVMDTVNDKDKSSVEPQKPVPDSATETEKELAKDV